MGLFVLVCCAVCSLWFRLCCSVLCCVFCKWLYESVLNVCYVADWLHSTLLPDDVGSVRSGCTSPDRFISSTAIFISKITILSTFFQQVVHILQPDTAKTSTWTPLMKEKMVICLAQTTTVRITVQPRLPTPTNAEEASTMFLVVFHTQQFNPSSSHK